jgi:hypothetical protein
VADVGDRWWDYIRRVGDEIDWSVTPRVAESYQRFSDPEVALGLIGGVFVPQDRDSCFRPLEMEGG